MIPRTALTTRDMQSSADDMTAVPERRIGIPISLVASPAARCADQLLLSGSMGSCTASAADLRELTVLTRRRTGGALEGAGEREFRVVADLMGDLAHGGVAVAEPAGSQG